MTPHMCPIHPYDMRPYAPDMDLVHRLVPPTGFVNYCQLIDIQDLPDFLAKVVATVSVLKSPSSGTSFAIEIVPRNNGHICVEMCYIGRDETEDDPR